MVAKRSASLARMTTRLAMIAGVMCVDSNVHQPPEIMSTAVSMKNTMVMRMRTKAIEPSAADGFAEMMAEMAQAKAAPRAAR